MAYVYLEGRWIGVQFIEAIGSYVAEGNADTQIWRDAKSFVELNTGIRIPLQMPVEDVLAAIHRAAAE